MNIKPIGKRVLIQRDNVSGKTAGGIYVPNQEPSVLGTVLEVSEEISEGKFGFTLGHLKEGDRVLLPKGGGVPINIKKDYQVEMFPIENIYAIITNE